mmetsp:Transcript_60328/g.148036  ORF Transcript_60328/g.148036 Transcript_60328/m.148036 type:complete len:516 (-) Transcript_60328:109-1656(-)
MTMISRSRSFFLVVFLAVILPLACQGWVPPAAWSSSSSSLLLRNKQRSFFFAPSSSPPSSSSSSSVTKNALFVTTAITNDAMAESDTRTRTAGDASTRYQEAVRRSHSFTRQEYQPAWFATNAHLQTIVGALYRKETMYIDKRTVPSVLSWTMSSLSDMLSNITDSSSSTSSTINNKLLRQRPLDVFHWDKRQRVLTDDDDFYHVDWKYCSEPQKETIEMSSSSSSSKPPVVLICHGLETNSNSPLAQDMAIAFNHMGFDAATINFRGCSGEPNLTPRAYHLGFYDDLLHFIKQINEKDPNRRIYLSGFSLGAGVVTKMLADLGDDVYKYNIAGAAVNAVPMDAGQCCSVLNGEGFSRTVYGDRFLKSMKERVRSQYDTCQFQFDLDEVDECQSIMDFENLLIAPEFGFEDAYDYYDRCKTIDVLNKVAVPELILQALDDPFFEGIEYPANNPDYAVNIQYTEYGGHCGFVFHTERDPESTASWMPFQLARFLSHLEKTRNQQGGGTGEEAEQQR